MTLSLLLCAVMWLLSDNTKNYDESLTHSLDYGRPAWPPIVQPNDEM